MNRKRRSRRITRQLRFEEVEDRRVLSVTFVDSGQTIGNEQIHVAVFGDVDGDHDQDLFVLNYGAPNEVWLNDGSGFFTSTGQKLYDSLSTAAALADMDSDGDLDAVVANHRGDLNAVWLNDGHGTFRDSGRFLGDSGRNDSLPIVDLDGDGDLDVVTLTRTIERDGVVVRNTVWLNDGKAMFTERDLNIHPFGSEPQFQDLDGDGDLDAVALCGLGDACLFKNEGTVATPDFGNRSIIANYSSDEAIAVGDVDGDSDIDIVIGLHVPGGPTPYVWLNTGNGSFTPHDFTMADQFSPVLGDVDGDHDLDAVVSRRNSTIYEIWLNNGAGDFAPEESILLAKLPWHQVPGGGANASLADVDGDGDLDVFVRGRLFVNLDEGELLEYDERFSPGDANRDGEFNQLDVVTVLDGGKYLTNVPATFEEGDWNADGVFDQLDIVAALQAGNYQQRQ